MRCAAAVQERQGASVSTADAAAPDVVSDRRVREPSATRLRGGGPSEKPLLTEQQVVRAMLNQYQRQIKEINIKNGMVLTSCGHWIHSYALPDGRTPITAENARDFWKPSLNDYKDKSKRTPDSHPALFYRQVTGEDWACQHFSNESYDRAAKTYNRLWGRDRDYEQARAEQRKLLGRKHGGAASGSSTAVNTATVATRDGAPDTSTVATTLRGVAQTSAHGTNGASGGALGSTSNVANAPRATGVPSVAPPSAHGPIGSSSCTPGRVAATCSVANAPREPAVLPPHAHGTGGASGIALGSRSSTVATAPKPRRDEERFAGDYEAYRRADKAWHEKRRRERLKSSGPYSTGARATSFTTSSNTTASRLPSASISSRAAAGASPLPSCQSTSQSLGALPLPDPASLLPPVPRVSLATDHEQREQRRAIEAAELAERLATERDVAATAHLEEWLIAERERMSGELQQVRAAQLQQWREAQSQLRPTRIVTDDDEAPSEMVSMCCAGDDHSEDEGVQPSPSLAARCGSTEAGSKHFEGVIAAGAPARFGGGPLESWSREHASADAASAISGCGVHASNMQLAVLERRLLDVECGLTQLRRQRSRDDEALIDGLQQRLQTERGAKRPIKEEYVKAATSLARDPAFARDPKLKKEDSWWASFPVPPGKSRTDARKNASTILEKGWLNELGGLVYTVPAVEKTAAYCERLGLERITPDNAATYPPPKLWDFSSTSRVAVDSPPAIWYWRMTGGNWSDSERSLSHEYHVMADRWRRLLDDYEEREARRDRLRKIEGEVTRAGELHQEAQDRYEQWKESHYAMLQSEWGVCNNWDKHQALRRAEDFRNGIYNVRERRTNWDLSSKAEAAEKRMIEANARKKRADGYALLHELATDAGRRLGRSQPVELMDGNAFDRYVERKDQPSAVHTALEAPAAQLVADLAQCLVCHLTFTGEHPDRIPTAKSATADVNELSAAFIEFELRRDAQSGMLSVDEVIALLDACDSWLDANGDEDSPHESDLFDRSDRLAELGCHWRDPTTRSEALETSLTVEDGYVGEEKDGVPEGRGSMRSANGDVYVGQWQAGKPHGLGTMRYSRGIVFDGEWSEGERVPVWSQAQSACHVGLWAVPALASVWVAHQQQSHRTGFSAVEGTWTLSCTMQWLKLEQAEYEEKVRREQEAREQKVRELEYWGRRRGPKPMLWPSQAVASDISSQLAEAKECLQRRAAEATRVTDEEAAILTEEQRCRERGECGPLKAEAFDVVSRLCEANDVTDCPTHVERLSRLLSIKEHGRAGPCQRCRATLMCSFTPEGEPIELFCIGRVCHRRTQDDGYIGGRQQIKQWWEWEDCGWTRKITPENKAKLLCRPLVDSKAGDLCKVVREQKAPSCSASASAPLSHSLGLGSGRWSASALSCAQDASSCPAEADTAPTTCAAPPGAPPSPTLL